MNHSRLPPQLLRLVILTLLILGTYVIARLFLTPATFGEYGHFRGAAIREGASRAPLFAGGKACNECHSETFEQIAKARHRNIACESCHGPNRPHVRNPDIVPVKLSDQLCLRCHVADAARPAKHPQVDVTVHFPGDKCLECHVAHQPNKSK